MTTLSAYARDGYLEVERLRRAGEQIVACAVLHFVFARVRELCCKGMGWTCQGITVNGGPYCAVHTALKREELLRRSEKGRAVAREKYRRSQLRKKKRKAS